MIDIKTIKVGDKVRAISKNPQGCDRCNRGFGCPFYNLVGIIANKNFGAGFIYVWPFVKNNKYTEGGCSGFKAEDLELVEDYKRNMKELYKTLKEPYKGV